jgi:hypothetical protein
MPGRLPAVTWLVLFVIAADLPFVNQAFHMDDGIYLLMARNIQQKPWFPQDVPLLFEGLRGGDLASTEHPWPFTSYFLALCALIGGYSERCLHLGFLVFPMILAASMWSISAGLTRHPVLATLTLLALPVVCVLSHTLMADIPLLALWLCSVALFRRGATSGRLAWAWGGAAVGALASLVTLSGLCLIPLLALYCLLRRKRAALVPALAAPAIVLGFWCTLNYLHYHRFTPAMIVGSYLAVKNVMAPSLVTEKMIFAVAALGALTVFPLFILALVRKGAVLGGLAGTLAAALIPRVSQLGPVQETVFLALFFVGFTTISDAAGSTIRSVAGLRSLRGRIAEDLFLGSWFLGMLLFCVGACMTGSARYLLPAMPPLVLILFRRLDSDMKDGRARAIAAANLVLCALMALSLSIADYQFAGIYKEFASTLAKSHPTGGRNVWFTGEWGLRAYLERSGAWELGRRDARAKPGDLLVVPTLATPYRTLCSDKLDLESIAMVSPSRVSFEVPPPARDSSLIYTVGMPYYAASDGMDFTIRFVSPEGDRILHHERLLPPAGRRWRLQQIPLTEVAGKRGRIELAADVGGSGNADGDWLAISRARIGLPDGNTETTVFDFRQHWNQARIEAAAGVDYHTDRNIPVFPMTVWLEQEPVVILRNRIEYKPALPLHLLDSSSQAGFWGSSWGLLPFSFAAGDTALETISVYEVIRQADGYGESTPSWYEK